MDICPMTDENIKNILIALAAGDVSGYIFEGMKKAHIKSVFRNNDPFPDPAPALKNNIHKWKKPGLYSSITQFMLLNGASIEKKSWNRDKFRQMVKNSPELPGLDYSYFRNPDAAARKFISLLKNPPAQAESPFTIPCSSLIPSSLPIIISGSDNENLIFSIISYSMLFTTDPGTAASAVAFCFLIKDLLKSEKQKGLHELSALSLTETVSFAQDRQDIIFRSGINPDYIIAKLIFIRDILAETVKHETISDCEDAICKEADKTSGNRITRASINMPEILFPFAVSTAARCSNPEDVFSTAAREGGSSSALSAIAGSIASAFYGDITPENILTGIVNRKKLLSLIELIHTEKGRNGIFEEMNRSEPPLTLKEEEEYNSKNRKNPGKKSGKKPKTRKDTEAEIAKHVVESWTKIDKAKWKKERNKHKI
jgi:ADP-ribosylglycohydrolase